MNPNLNGEAIAPPTHTDLSPYGHGSPQSGTSPHAVASDRSHTAPSQRMTSSNSPNSQSSRQGAQPSLAGMTGSAPGSTSGGASVPINLYRDLAAELHNTQHQLKVMSDRHEALAQQNQQLRAEVAHLIHSVLQLRHAANQIQPDAPIMPELDAKLESGIPFQADLGQSASAQTLEEALAAAIAKQSEMMPPAQQIADTDGGREGYASAQPVRFTMPPSGKTGSIKMPSHPHPRPVATVPSQAVPGSREQGRATAPVFRGWGIVAVVVMVVVTGFGMGFATTIWMQARNGSSSN